MFNLRVLQPGSPWQLRAEIEKIGAAPSLWNDHVSKAGARVVRLENVAPRLARFVYQELMLEGGDVVLPARLDDQSSANIDFLLLGSNYQLRHLSVRLRTQRAPGEPETELDLLAAEIDRALSIYDGDYQPGAIKIRSTQFDWGKRTYVMGIVNATPDSFSGDGILRAGADLVQRAVAQGVQMVVDGADILDVGGESTRPGSQPTPAEEEFRRVIPVIAELRQQVAVPLSVDTYKADVARAALDAGADIINDVWGLRMDPDMKRVAAERRVPIVIMHNRSQPKDASQTERLGGRYIGVEYGDLLGDVIRELRLQVESGTDAGIAPQNIIIDPGIGFGKTVEQNIELLDRLSELRVLGFPILLGASRKGFIGYKLDLPVDQRMEGTAAAVALGIERGADIVRVHDVKSMARVAKMTDAIVRSK